MYQLETDMELSCSNGYFNSRSYRIVTELFVLLIKKISLLDLQNILDGFGYFQFYFQTTKKALINEKYCHPTNNRAHGSDW